MTTETETFIISLSSISGYLLSQIRNRMNLSQRDMAKLFDITQGAYGNMERGEANINAEFIFMLCSLVGIKTSDYFSLIEEIMIEFTNIRTNKYGNKIRIEIISSNEINKRSTDFKLYLQATEDKNLSDKILKELREDYISKTDDKTIITAEEVEFFISEDIISKVAVLSKVRLSKDEIKQLVNIKSKDIEKKILKSNNNSDPLSIGISSPALLGTVVAGPLGFLVGSLFKSYKESKEDKKK